MLKAMGCSALLAMAVVACGQGNSSERLDSVMQGVGGVPPSFCGQAAGAPPTGVIVDVIADTELDKTIPTTNLGNLETCTVRGGANERHCLLRFDLTSIATSTPVLGGCLLLVVADTSTSNFSSYELLKSWGHTTATWQRATPFVTWDGPGAWAVTDRGSDVVATLPKNHSGWLMVPLAAALVQKWVANPSTNYGIIFGGSSTNGASISSIEGDAGNAPQLAVWTGP